jgi:LysM repeat protein
LTATATATTHKHGHNKSHPRRYTIKSGDTLAAIAAANGTTVAALVHLNPGIDPSALRVGQTIRVK